MYLVLRTAGDPTAFARAARAAVYSVDAQLPVAQVRTLLQARSEHLSELSFGARLMSAFALLALLLATVGLYGVIAHTVTQRTHEIGVRMALGARRGHVLRLVVGKGIALTAIGLVLGLAGGTVAVRLLGSVLLGTVHNEVLLLVGFSVAVALVALLGSYVPARRATRLDPMIALRRD
jgi:putative ABC transport system permease protein